MKYLAILALLAAATPAFAAPEPANPELRTQSGLYVTAAEAGTMKATDMNGVLLVDIREPVEIMFTGFTDMADINVPFRLVNPSKWHPKKPFLAMEPNPAFVEGIDDALARKGLDRDAPVLLMCRSGTRGAPAARMLEGLGFTQAYVVVDGFEGSTAKDGPKGPQRNVSGWKNSGLPWSYKLDSEKIYLRSSQNTAD